MSKKIIDEIDGVPSLRVTLIKEIFKQLNPMKDNIKEIRIGSESQRKPDYWQEIRRQAEHNGWRLERGWYGSPNYRENVYFLTVSWSRRRTE